MADIGPITAKVVATASGMATGLADAEKKLKASTSKMADQAKKDGAAAGKGFASALTQGLLIGGGMKLFDLGLTAFGKLTELFTGGAARMAEVGKAARQAGADVAGFQVIVEALGNDLPSATEGVLKLKEAMGKALVEGQTDTFDRLGVNVVELMGLREDEAFVKVAERLRELGGGVAEARAGMVLFGDKFKDLRHILDDGGEQIRLMARDLKAFGADFGDGAFLQSREWARAMNQFSLLWKGLQNQIAMGVMPVINEFFARVGSLADMGITFKGVGETIISVVNRIGQAILYVKESFSDTSLIRKGWDVLFAHIRVWMLSLMREFQRSMATALRGSKWTRGLAETFSIAAAQNDNALFQARGDAKYGFRELEEILAGKASFQSWAKVIESAYDRLRSMVFQGPKNIGPDLFRLWEEGAERMSKALEGPVDKFRDALKQVKALSALKEAWLVGPMPEGGGPITDAQALTLAGAFNQLRGGFGGAPSYNPAAAMLEGSREAYSAVNAFRQSTGRESVEEALKRIMQQQLEQEREQLRVGKEVAAAAKKLANNLVPRGID